jgi:hypothetical protein
MQPRSQKRRSYRGVRRLLCTYARHHQCEVGIFDQGFIDKFPEITAAPPAIFA